MEWVCEQHQKGKYLYTNACCNQVDIGLQRAFPTFSHESQQKGELKCSVNKMLKNMTAMHQNFYPHSALNYLSILGL